MSLTTLFLIVFVLYPLASLMTLLTLCLAFEYCQYRSKQLAEEHMKAFLGEDEADVDLEPKQTILDYSGTSPN